MTTPQPAALPELPEPRKAKEFGYNGDVFSADQMRAYALAALQSQPAAPEFNGWYCAHCQRGVDAIEVTYHEQHTVCGRVITNDAPPAPQPAAETALQKFVRLNVADEVRSPLEQLRSFCSFAMSGQDWIDCEPFFDAIVEAAQPAAAEVSDGQIDRICYLATEIRFAKTDDAAQAVIDQIRAILALRPQAVPMTDEQIVAALKACDREDPSKEGWIWRTRIKWARAVEAHHGITAHGAQGEQA